jgi:hypothetical protein
MSLNNIALSELIVTEWYGDSTLIPSANPDALRPATPPVETKPAAAPPVATTPVAAPPVTTKQEPVIPKQQPIAPPPAFVKPAEPPAQPKPPVEPTTLPAESTAYKFLGNHRRKVTIIVDSPGAAFLPDDQLNFLSKILEACRMNVGDVAIVNHHTTPVVIAALREQLHPANIILFGVDPIAIRLPINFPAFKLQPYDNCTYLCTPPLEQLVGNTADAKLLKSKLWICLKTLFGV